MEVQVNRKDSEEIVEEIVEEREQRIWETGCFGCVCGIHSIVSVNKMKCELSVSATVSSCLLPHGISPS